MSEIDGATSCADVRDIEDDFRTAMRFQVNRWIIVHASFDHYFCKMYMRITIDV